MFLNLVVIFSQTNCDSKLHKFIVKPPKQNFIGNALLDEMDGILFTYLINAHITAKLSLVSVSVLCQCLIFRAIGVEKPCSHRLDRTGKSILFLKIYFIEV